MRILETEIGAPHFQAESLDQIYGPEEMFVMPYNPNLKNWQESVLYLLHQDNRLKHISASDLNSFIDSDGRSYWYMHPEVIPEVFSVAKEKALELQKQSKLWTK